MRNCPSVFVQASSVHHLMYENPRGLLIPIDEDALRRTRRGVSPIHMLCGEILTCLGKLSLPLRCKIRHAPGPLIRRRPKPLENSGPQGPVRLVHSFRQENKHSRQATQLLTNQFHGPLFVPLPHCLFQRQTIKLCPRRRLPLCRRKFFPCRLTRQPLSRG